VYACLTADAPQNLPNDEFARRVDAFADTKGLSAWSGIGHSQARCVGDSERGVLLFLKVGTSPSGRRGAGASALNVLERTGRRVYQARCTGRQGCCTGTHVCRRALTLAGRSSTHQASHTERRHALEGARAVRACVRSVSLCTHTQGCSGAGSGANLIKLFGVACGANADLTPDGAALWLTTGMRCRDRVREPL
jgi:hypothetical protein